MRYLIDTTILIRLRTETSLISKDIFQIIENPENLIYVSAVSIQEIFMLLQTNKIVVPKWKSAKDVFEDIENTLNFKIKYIKKEHLTTFYQIAPVKDHGDPFDRLIIAQSLTERMPLISSDQKMKYYKRQGLTFIANA
ncbi:MAG: type II toxin-antitoxin system VapC family toxin [Prevotellaceae bacterium]|jgi:PIN domain nuclease of toxin-antitoxin system|nr:type II toxin-antitoxin system VapC family toxin [Prevotellaceae bacterium]